MILTEEDFLKIEKRRGEMNPQNVLLSSGNFYIKYRPRFKENAICEIIMAKVAEILGVVCPKYYLYIPEFKENGRNECFILSEDLEHIGPFFLAISLGIGANTNASVKESWQTLAEHYGNNPTLSKELVAIYLLSLFFGFSDFHNKNWGVIQNNDEERIAILDNEYSFENDIKPKMSAFPSKIDYDLEVDLNPLMINLAYFLETASADCLSLFESMYYLFTPEYLVKILKMIEESETIITRNGNVPLKIAKEDILERYTKTYEDITKVWHNYQNTLKKSAGKVNKNGEFWKGYSK